VEAVDLRQWSRECSQCMHGSLIRSGVGLLLIIHVKTSLADMWSNPLISTRSQNAKGISTGQMIIILVLVLPKSYTILLQGPSTATSRLSSIPTNKSVVEQLEPEHYMWWIMKRSNWKQLKTGVRGNTYILMFCLVCHKILGFNTWPEADDHQVAANVVVLREERD
jgi:hypothetical protein